MKSSIFEGKLIRLRALTEDDWTFYHSMDQDSETARGAYLIPFPRSPQAAQQWAKETSLQTPHNDAFRFTIEQLDPLQPVGTLNTHDCDARNGTFSYGIAIHPDFRQQGFARESILLTLNYFFKELRYHKCTVGVYSFNHASLRLHDQLGFTREGMLRNMQYSNGQYHDHIFFGLTSSEFNQKYGSQFQVEIGS